MPRSTSTPSNPAQAPAPVVTMNDWTCPFCPLLCDDIAAQVLGDERVAAPATACPRLADALATFGASDAAAQPSIDGAPATLDAALARATTILGDARRPLFGGLATDIAGARRVYELASHCGAIVDHLHGDALAAATAALQDRGAFFTTLSEVRTRANLIVVFGCRPSQRYPRFYERIRPSAATERAILFVGCDADPAADASVSLRGEAPILPHGDPYDVLALWSAVAEGRLAHLPDTRRGDIEALAALDARIRQARYTALVYEPAALGAPHGALLIEAFNRIVKTVNKTVRAGGLPLGGDAGGASLNQAITWLSGLPLRTRVPKPAAHGTPTLLDHDPQRYRTERLLAAREVDALLWIASFDPQRPPDALDPGLPLVVLGHPGLAAQLGARQAPTVFIPVATPGIDGDAHLFRVDASVVVPLQAVRGAKLPSVAAIAASLVDRIREGSA